MGGNQPTATYHIHQQSQPTASISSLARAKRSFRFLNETRPTTLPLPAALSYTWGLPHCETLVTKLAQRFFRLSPLTGPRQEVHPPRISAQATVATCLISSRLSKQEVLLDSRQEALLPGLAELKPFDTSPANARTVRAEESSSEACPSWQDWVELATSVNRGFTGPRRT